MPVALPFIAAASAVASVGLSLYGNSKNAAAQRQANAAQQEQIRLQQQVEAQRQKAMELDARRKQMEILRQQQRARSIAVAAANNQGALFGSGLQGGLGQISGQADTQQLGVQQSLDIGRNIFGLNAGISQTRIDMANAQSSALEAQSITSLGGTILRSAGMLGSLAQGFGSIPQQPYNNPSAQYGNTSTNAGYAGSFY